MTEARYDYRRQIRRARELYHAGNMFGAAIELGGAAGIGWSCACIAGDAGDNAKADAWSRRRGWAFSLADWVQAQALERRLP